MNIMREDSIKKEKKGTIVCICLLYAFFVASGAIYFNTRVVGIKKIDILFIALVVSVLWSCRKSYIILTKMHFWIFGLMCVYFYNNATKAQISDFPILFLFPAMLCMILTSLRMPTDWFKVELSILRKCYIFYALYTILMRINPIFFTIAVQFFPEVSSKTTMLEQYSNGWMVGFTTHYSTNGMLLSVGALIYFTAYIYGKKKIDGIWSIVFAIALLLTGKRAHVLFTFFAVFFGYYLYESSDKRSRRQKIFAVIIIVIVILFIIINYVPTLSTFFYRFVETEENGDVTMGRSSVWQTTLEVFKTNPLIGIGWGQFQRQGYWSFNAHNIYVQLLCETGIIGSLFYFSFFGYMIYETYKVLKELREKKVSSYVVRLLLFSYSYQIFFLLYGFTGNPLYDQIMYIPYFFSCSITLNYLRKRFEKEEV